MTLFGASEWPARTPSLLGGMLALAGLFLLLRRWGDAGTARWSAVALVTQPLLLLGAQFANLDMLVAGCIAATICCSRRMPHCCARRGCRTARRSRWPSGWPRLACWPRA